MLNDVARAASWAAGYGHIAQSSQTCRWRSIDFPDFPDLKVLSLDATLFEDYKFIPEDAQAPLSVLDFCNVTIAYTHPGWHDVVTVGKTLVMNVVDVMVDWVEKGIAPDTLPANGKNRNGVELTRNICMYPRVQHCIGGDVEDPSSFQYV